jgi:DNA (cytosine-5)-methyltransferase 1
MFSGCGGMSAGFMAVNGAFPAYRLLGALDIDPIANATYAKNVGLVPDELDVARLARRPALLRAFLERIGYDARRPLVMIGCAPCQGFSSHRNEHGAGDPRNHLFVDFANVVTRLRPVAAVMENVPEILTTRSWPLVTHVRSKLERAGYAVRIGVVNMAEFGVPQERFRALILALRHPFLLPNGFLKRSEFRTVRQAIGGLPKILPGERCPTDSMHFTAGHSPSTVATIAKVPKDGGRRPPGVGPECLRRIERKQGRSGYDDVYGRLYWDRPAITITAYARNPASGRYAHPEQNRGLSVREAALLQGFPPEFHFEGTLDEKFRQIGNAVPPAFAGFVASYLLGELAGPSLTSRTAPAGITTPVGPSFSRLIPAIKAGTSTGHA